MNTKLNPGDKLSDQSSGRDMYKVIKLSGDKCTLERYRYYSDKESEKWYTFVVSIESVKNKIESGILVKY